LAFEKHSGFGIFLLGKTGERHYVIGLENIGEKTEATKILPLG